MHVTVVFVDIPIYSIEEPQNNFPLSYKKNACYRKHESSHSILLFKQP